MISFLISLLFQPVYAVTTKTISPTTTPVATATAVPTNNDEIQKIREVVQQKVKEKLQSIINPSQSSKKGLVGKVIQIDNSTITIEYLNSTSTLKIDSSTVYVDGNRNKSKLENIKIGQDILALGVSENNVFTAKRIVTTDLKTLSAAKTIVIGKIVDISKTTSIFTLIPSKNKNNLYQIKTDAKSEINDKSGQKIATNGLKSGQKVIVVLTPDPKTSKTYYASKIYNLDYTPEPSLTPKPTTIKK